MKGKPTMTLKELLNITNSYDQIRIAIESEVSDSGLVTIFKGTAQDAIHYFNGSCTLNSKVQFIKLVTDTIINARCPIMHIVIA